MIYIEVVYVSPMNPPKRSIHDPAKFLIRTERAELDKWRAAARQRGVTLTALIRQAMAREIGDACDGGPQGAADEVGN